MPTAPGSLGSHSAPLPLFDGSTAVDLSGIYIEACPMGWPQDLDGRDQDCLVMMISGEACPAVRVGKPLSRGGVADFLKGQF